MDWDSVEVEWVGPGGVARRTGIEGCADADFEAGSPVRGFSSYRGQRHFPGLWWSATTSSHIAYESWLERDHVMFLDADPHVVGIAGQPLRLTYRVAGKPVSHIPDFFARFDDGGSAVVDVRPANRVGAKDKAKFDATAEFCTRVPGWSFRLVHEPDPIRVGNMRWLSGFRHPRHRACPWLAELVAVFAEPRPLMEGVGKVGDPIAVLPGLFHLMWCGALAADLDRAPLDDATVVMARHAGGAR